MAKEINFQPIFDYIDQNNGVLAKVIEERFKQNNDELWKKIEENFAGKKDIEAITDRLDWIVKFVKKLDEERLFSVEWLKRVEGEVDRIKKHLQIV